MWLELSLLIYTCLLYIMISGSMIYPWYFNIEIIGYLPDLWYIHDILIYLKLLDTCLTEWDICILHVLITKISPSDGQSVLNLSNFTNMSFDLQRNGAESFLGETLEGWFGRKSKNILNCLQKSITLRIFMNIFFLRNNEDYASIIVQYHCVYWSNQATVLEPGTH